jgi:hypothetical protein
MEYARSLVRKSADSDSGDDVRALAASPSVRASTAPSEDWSVISDSEDMALSMSMSSAGSGRSRSMLAKRNSITSAMLSVLPDLSMSGHRRSNSTSAVSAAV